MTEAARAGMNQRDNLFLLDLHCGCSIAISDANMALTFGELWNAVSGLAETLAGDTGPRDLIAILLPAGPLFPLAMLACLAAGRPFVALDPRHPPDWLSRVLQEARATLVITAEKGRRKYRKEVALPPACSTEILSRTCQDGVLEVRVAKV